MPSSDAPAERPPATGQPADPGQRGRAELVAEIARLQAQVARLSLQQQKHIATRDRLDRELQRFALMQGYNVRAINLNDLGDFVSATVEAAVEIFEPEFAALWLATGDEQLAATTPAGLAGIPGDQIPEELVNMWWRTGLQAGNRARALRAETSPRMDLADLRSALVAPCVGPTGIAHGLLVIGVTASGGQFHDDLGAAHLGAFTLFAQQVGTLLGNRSVQSVIADQVARLELEQERLTLALDGSKAGLWDWDLETNQFYFSDRSKDLLGH